MRLLSIIKKSYKEQIRSFWILILTISMAPFFVFVYYLIMESSKPHYEILIVNEDAGKDYKLMGNFNLGDYLIESFKQLQSDTFEIPLSAELIDSKEKGIELLKNKKADALIYISPMFTEQISKAKTDSQKIDIEFIGDLTNINYMIAAVWAGEILSTYIEEATGIRQPIKLTESGIGNSATTNDFIMAVPGLLVLSLIMLMFTATIAIVKEIENKTMMRLKLSKLTTFEFLTGISIIQVFVGIAAILLTLFVALALGFESKGSIILFLLISILCSISIVAFSLILAALTKTVNEVLVIGNFPLFIFMFFSGAMYPIHAKTLFTIGHYDFTIIGLLSPNHAITAINKVLILDSNFMGIWPELISLIILTIVYFALGVWLFNRRHMKAF